MNYLRAAALAYISLTLLPSQYAPVQEPQREKLIEERSDPQTNLFIPERMGIFVNYNKIVLA